MDYIITNGRGSYIRQDRATNRYVPVQSKSHATHWSDRKKAYNVYNTLAKHIKPNYHVAEIQSEPEVADMELSSLSLSIEQVSSKLPINDPQCHGAEWISSIKEVLKYLHNLDSRLNELKAMQTEIDREICDIYHYIEFKQLNASQGYKAYRALHEVLLRRRVIKDEIYTATAIKNHSPGRFDFDTAIQMIDGMSSREYKPRTLEGIFTGGV